MRRPTITIKTPAEMMPTSNAVTSIFDWDSPLSVNPGGKSHQEYTEQLNQIYTFQLL